MKLFSLDWFKSEKTKQLEELRLKEQTLSNELLEAQIKTEVSKTTYKSLQEPIIHSKPYKKIKLINDVLTIVLNDGNILSKPNATQEDFIKARSVQSESELFKIATSSEGIEEKRQEEAKIEEVKTLLNGIEILKSSADFIVEDNTVYLKGINRSLPELLVKRFIAVHPTEGMGQSEEYQALKKFWLKCCLNPNAQSAEDLYDFLTYHHFKIDKHGNFYAYRRVESEGEDNKELTDFISNAYNKIKAVWKKKPADYEIWRKTPFDSGEFILRKKGIDLNLPDGEAATGYGNLEELYKNLPNLKENRYTDNRTKSYDYRVGEVISMPRNEGDDDNSVSCSYGFHAASEKYDYTGFGDTPILMIINPIDVLAVPKGEVGKLRTCRWFFAMTLPEDEKFILRDNDFDVTELGDIFEEKCAENLQGYVQNSFAEEVKRHTFTLPNITGEEVNRIVLSLEDMKNTLSKRVSVID